MKSFELPVNEFEKIHLFLELFTMDPGLAIVLFYFRAEKEHARLEDKLYTAVCHWR